MLGDWLKLYTRSKFANIAPLFIFIILAIVLAIVLGVVILTAVVFNNDYYDTLYYEEVALVVDETDAEILTYTQEASRMCLVVSRGSTHSQFVTDNAWHESIIIDIPKPQIPKRIDFNDSNTKLGFVKSGMHGTKWIVGQQGIDGYIHIRTIDSKSISVDYHIVIHADTISQRLHPGRKDFVFEGRSAFVKSEIQHMKTYGVLWQPPKK